MFETQIHTVQRKPTQSDRTGLCVLSLSLAASWVGIELFGISRFFVLKAIGYIGERYLY